jgi:hypothetical protein
MSLSFSAKVGNKAENAIGTAILPSALLFCHRYYDFATKRKVFVIIVWRNGWETLILSQITGKYGIQNITPSSSSFT